MEVKDMKKITILLIALIVICVGFLSGCTEFEEDLGEALEGEVVNVSVYAYADVINDSGIPLNEIQVQFDLSKTGGADFTYSDLYLNMNGRAACPYVGYNLHEGEIIHVTASVMGIPGGLSSGSATLTFNNAKENAQELYKGVLGYRWEPKFNLVI